MYLYIKFILVTLILKFSYMPNFQIDYNDISVAYIT